MSIKLLVTGEGAMTPGDVFVPAGAPVDSGYEPVPDYDLGMTELCLTDADVRRGVANKKRKFVLSRTGTFGQLPPISGTSDEPVVWCSDDPHVRAKIAASKAIHAPKGLAGARYYNLHMLGQHDANGISFLGPSQGLFFQDVLVEGFLFGLSSGGHEQYIHDVEFNRCTFMDNFNPSGGMASGLHIAGASWLTLNECIFDRNGSNPDGSQPEGQRIRSHNCYINWDCSIVTTRRCIFTHGAQNGLMQRSGGLVEDCFFADQPVPYVVGAEADYDRPNKEPRNRYVAMHVAGNLAHNHSQWGAEYTNPMFSYIGDNAFHKIAKFPWHIKTDEMAFATVLDNNTLHECNQPEIKVISDSGGELKHIHVDGVRYYYADERNGPLLHPFEGYSRDDGPRSFALPDDFYERLRNQSQENWESLIDQVHLNWAVGT